MSAPLKVSRFAHTIFCDDVRREDNGKLLILGAYSFDLRVHQLPAVLPSFCMLVTVATPAHEKFGRVVIRVLLDDDVLQELDTSPGDYHPVFRQSQSSDPAMVQKIVALVRLQPFVILRAGTLRVRVETESEVLPGGALNIEVMPETEGKTDEISTGG